MVADVRHEKMKKITTLLLVCLGLCSCQEKVETKEPAKSFSVTAKVISADVMHDSFVDRPHEITSVVKYRIITPSDLAGREFTMFYPITDGTNRAPSVDAVVTMEIKKAFLDAQAKE